MTIKELLAARTAPGKWEVSEDDEYVCVTMDGPDDYTPLGYPDERNTAAGRTSAVITKRAAIALPETDAR